MRMVFRLLDQANAEAKKGMGPAGHKRVEKALDAAARILLKLCNTGAIRT